ncbi:MAG: HEPN domain-containing protein [Candidatus Nanoarchaeia archaeon]|nr:HEPN domain-containing protein [Candidatus Nanoarchaeia archaeon]
MGKQYIRDWERAEGFLKAAESNLRLNDYRTAANREYFACESAVCAVLKLKGIAVRREHKDIWVKSAFISQNAKSLLRELYDLRLQADYGKASVITPLSYDIAEEYLEKVKEFIGILGKEAGILHGL